jgi:hypothetical protein
MRLFTCENCAQPVYFENTSCVACGTTLGYQPDANRLLAVRGDRLLCENAQHLACNWLVPEGTTDAFCRSCRHNVTIPNLSVPENVTNWRKIQEAQRRAMYSFLRLGLPLASRVEEPQSGLGFEILADGVDPNKPKIMTAHDFGLITIALAEADDAERSSRRMAMGEPYRTILGHFRHESGHYFWDRLVRDTPMLEPCRAVFGDDSVNYDEALKRHHANGPPANWQEEFVSSYATCHPWEDFAETWAHYLHIADTLEMARSFGIGVEASTDKTGTLSGTVDFDPYRETEITRLMEAWVPITAAVNSLNRCMGVSDLYPFVLSPKVIEKLGFIQTLVHGGIATR